MLWEFARCSVGVGEFGKKGEFLLIEAFICICLLRAWRFWMTS